jgi:hypothetical protein
MGSILSQGLRMELMGQKGLTVRPFFRAALSLALSFFYLKLNLFPLLYPLGSERLFGMWGDSWSLGPVFMSLSFIVRSMKSTLMS